MCTANIYHLALLSGVVSLLSIINLATADAQAALPAIDVSGERTQAEGSVAEGYRATTTSAGVLGTRTLKDTPYSVNVISQDLMQNLQAQSAADALKYDPSVYNGAASNTVGGGASFVIRGFTTDTNESFIDGMRMYSSTPIEDKEKIEVVNGPATFLFGFANPAGVVNYVLKRPTSLPYFSFTGGNYGGAQGYGHLDLSGSLDSEGKLAYRLNLLYVGKGDTPVAGDTHERSLISGAVDWHITNSTLLMFDYSHAFYNIQGGDDLFTLSSTIKALPPAPDPAKNFMPSYAQSYDGYDRYGVALKSQINEIFSARAAFAFDDVDMYRNRPREQLTDALGDYTFSRNYYHEGKQTLEGYGYLDADFKTWDFKHKVTLGFTEENTNFKYANPYANQTVSYSGTGNIFLPITFPAEKPGVPIGSPNRTFEQLNLISSSLVDIVDITNQWSILGGATFASVNDLNWSYASFATTGASTALPAYNRNAVTPSAAIMYKPFSFVTAYTSYIEALQEGPTAPSTALNANQTLAPYLARQVEIGAKTTWNQLDINAALFHITKANAYTDLTSNIYSEDGKETHNGIEFITTGHILPELTVTGGFTLLNARVTNAASASLTNKVPQAVPQDMARLYAEYAVPYMPGLFFAGGVSYNGSIYADALNTLVLPSVTVGDLGVRYQTKIEGHDLILRVNVNNFTDKRYWAISNTNLVLGAPRTIAFSAQTIF